MMVVKSNASKNLMRHVLGNKRSGGHFIATSVRARLRTLLRFLGVATSSRVFIGQLQPLSGIDIASNLFMPPYAALHKYGTPSTALTFRILDCFTMFLTFVMFPAKDSEMRHKTSLSSDFVDP